MTITTRIGTQWRQSGELVLDLPDGRRLRCEGIPRRIGQAVAGLEPLSGRPSSLRLEDARWSAWLHTLLSGEDAPDAWRWRPTIAIHGCGPLGGAVALALSLAGFQRLVLFDDSAAAPPALTRADAVRAELAAAGYHNAFSGHHRGGGEARYGCDLAICVPETAETDRDLTDGLLRADTPHLVTSFVGRTAAVGPLVVPGATGCVRCGDLAAAAADPGWVPLLAARTRRKVALGPAVQAWVVATIVQQVLAWQAHGRPETLGASLELDTGDWLLRSRPGTVNAACGCHDS